MQRLLRLVPALLLGATAAGCSARADEGRDPGVTIAASFYPLAWVAGQVAPRARITDLTQPGVEPHDIELTFAQTVDLARADLVVYEGGFQAAVDQGVANDAEGVALDVGPVAGLEPFLDDPGQTDPHFWQDPARMSAVVAAIADYLGRLDPARTASYDASAAGLQARLARLDHAFRSGLADCRRDTIVSSHDAFGYLSKYGIHVAAITGLAPGAEPTPADLSRLQRLIRNVGITTVFSETLVSPAMADTLAHDMGVQSRVLDPIEGLSSATAGENYLTLMYRNLRTLEEANGCRT